MSIIFMLKGEFDKQLYCLHFRILHKNLIDMLSKSVAKTLLRRAVYHVLLIQG